jgi:ArsR family transcriptional regulator, cadmium/lead-responsive transcriptional repressor
MAESPPTSLTLRAKLFRGLADPSRLAIVETLRQRARTVSEIVTATTLSQPNVSAHLACLKGCGLLASRQMGKHVIYALSDPHLEVLMQAADAILSATAERISCCSNYECVSTKQCSSGKHCASSARPAPAALNNEAAAIPLAADREGRGRQF